jgi:hypothetical protein
LDGDSLTSEIIACADENCLPISSYQQLSDFGPFSYDPFTRTISWAPSIQGEYAIAVKFYEWRDLGNGNYTLVGTVIRDFPITVIGDCSLLGISANSQNNFISDIKISPNPNTGEFKLNLGETYNSTLITVYDISGKIVLEKNLIGHMNGNSIDFEIPNAESGLYLLKIETEKGIKSVKFIVE